mgnify:CR=1 FL=1
MHLSVAHDTVYDYRPAVETAQHTAHLQPRHTALQRVLAFDLQVSPTPDSLRHGQDAFGNPQAWWTLAQAHTQLRVVARSTVQTAPPLELQGTQPWEAVREHFRYRSGQPGDAQTCFVFGSHHAPLHEAFAAYARSCFGPGRALQDAATALMRQIHSDFEYASQSTDVHTPALDALQARRGVCQDFAHIMIACLRSLGLPVLHATWMQEEPGEQQLDLLEQASEYFALTLTQARAIIKEVAAVTSTWRDTAKAVGARSAEITRMAVYILLRTRTLESRALA